MHLSVTNWALADSSHLTPKEPVLFVNIQSEIDTDIISPSFRNVPKTFTKFVSDV